MVVDNPWEVGAPVNHRLPNHVAAIVWADRLWHTALAEQCLVLGFKVASNDLPSVALLNVTASTVPNSIESDRTVQQQMHFVRETYWVLCVTDEESGFIGFHKFRESALTSSQYWHTSGHGLNRNHAKWLLKA